MKKFILFFYCITGYLNAQSNFNVAYHDKVESTGPSLLELFGGYHYVTLRNDALNFGVVYFNKAVSGTIKYRIACPVGFIPTRAKKTLDNKIIYIGGPGMCDVIAAPFYNYIIKHDTNGVITFTNYVSENVMDNPVDIIQYSDSTYYVFTDSIMYHFDKNGIFLLRKNTGLKKISSALFDSSGGGDIYLSAEKNSVKALCMINTSGIVTNTLSSPVLYSKMEFYGGSQIMAMGTDGNLYKYSYNFVLLGNSGTSSFGNVTDFVVAADTIYGITLSAIEKYFSCDSAFTTLFIANLQSAGITQKRIAYSQKKVGILSEAYSKLTPNWPGSHTYVTLNVIDRASGNDFTEDIAIVSTVADSLYATVAVSSSTTVPNQYSMFLRAKIKVKNKGTSSLNTFNLNHYIYPDVACGANWFQQNYSVTVAPGDTIEILTPFLQIPVYISGPVLTTVTHTVCLFGTIPNGRADKYHQDNELCNSFNFPVQGVGVKENFLDQGMFNIYPNPFTSKLTIENTNIIHRVILTDQVGRTIFLKQTEIKNPELDLKELETGIYFIKIQTEKGSVTKKVIKN